MRQTGKKPKLVLFPHEACISARAGKSADDFAIYATYRIAHGRFLGALKVVRKTDSRLLFPFDGAPTIGPYDTKEDALRAATALGAKIVKADIDNPEL
jgi:hypothetical protein